MEIVNEYNRVEERALFAAGDIWNEQQLVPTHKAIVNDEGSPIAVVGKNTILFRTLTLCLSSTKSY
jgi:hypothetical protein